MLNATTEIISSVHHACICPSWSADGTRISYSTVSRGNYDASAEPMAAGMTGEDVWIIDLDGRNNLRLTQGDAANFLPNWSPDGRVFFCSDRKGMDNVWSIKPRRVDLGADKPVDLSSHPQGGILAN